MSLLSRVRGCSNLCRHLKVSQKDEWESNPGDLRELGERAISFFNLARSRGGEAAASAATGGGADVGEEKIGGGEDVGEEEVGGGEDVGGGHLEDCLGDISPDRRLFARSDNSSSSDQSRSRSPIDRTKGKIFKLVRMRSQVTRNDDEKRFAE